jgi:hypothetical protein
MSTPLLTFRRRDLAWATALLVLLSVVWVARGDQAQAGGAPPGGEGIAVVYVAVGTNFPDSLGVGPGGGVNGAPIIIVPTNPPLPAPTAAELVRLDPRRVVIVGGTAVVSASMEAAIGSLLPHATVERIGGANRYETNALFSQATFPVEAWASIPAAAFTAPQPATHTVEVGDTGVHNATNGFLHAPIQLPHGAEILELRVSGFDSSASFNPLAVLVRVDHNAVFEIVASVQSSGTLGQFTLSTQSITSGNEIVDNGEFSYDIATAQTQSFFARLTHVMVRYRLGVPGG